MQEGLRGIKIGTTTVCTVGEGHDLFYRGFDIIEMAEKGIFEEVAYLLLHDKLPNAQELIQFQTDLKGLRDLPDEVKKSLELIPATAHPMDVMRIGASMLGVVYPEGDFSNQMQVAYRLLAAFPSVMCYWHRFVTDGTRIDTALPELETMAEQMYFMLHDRKPNVQQQKAMDISLILYAEHEINASTFTARVITATLADFYSAVAGAIGALKGPLHGGANEAVMDLLVQFNTPEEATAGVKSMLANKQKIMGFGHAVYKTRDPRNVVIKEVARNLAYGDSPHKNSHYYAVAEAIETVIWDEKNLFPNLDFYSACSYHFLDIPTYLFTPIFVCSRLTGWAAHIFEQRANNKLIRPSADYVGVEKASWVDLADRP